MPVKIPGSTCLADGENSVHLSGRSCCEPGIGQVRARPLSDVLPQGFPAAAGGLPGCFIVLPSFQLRKILLRALQPMYTCCAHNALCIEILLTVTMV